MLLDGFICERIIRKVGITMIRIDFNKLEITGPKPIVEAEFTALLKN